MNQMNMFEYTMPLFKITKPVRLIELFAGVGSQAMALRDIGVNLESVGYQSYYKLLNARDYGIPQNRNRCFMISVLGNYNYTFPYPVPLKNCAEICKQR